MTFSIFPRPSSRLNCCSMFCNCDSAAFKIYCHIPLQKPCTHGYKCPLFDINTVRMLASTMILWFLDRIYNSGSVLQIRHVDNRILYYVLSSKISTSTMIVMVPPLFSSSASLFSLSPLRCGGAGMYMQPFFFFFHIMRARALH